MLVDFSKAFDRVDHTVVINNLIKLAISGLVVKWFASFLKSRQQRVKIANHLSSWLVLRVACATAPEIMAWTTYFYVYRHNRQAEIVMSNSQIY